MNLNKDFPKEFFVEIETDDFREGRISVNQIEDGFMAEIDIVQIETRKIWKHVKSIFGRESAHDALEDASYYLGKFLRGESVN